MLNLPLERLAYIIEKAREFEAEIPADAAEEGSNPSDDDEVEILLDTPDNPTLAELRLAIDGLDIDERTELLALTWLGRGDFDRAGWHDALRQARDAVTDTESDYLVGTPQLAYFLEEGASILGLSLDGVEPRGL